MGSEKALVLTLLLLAGMFATWHIQPAEAAQPLVSSASPVSWTISNQAPPVRHNIPTGLDLKASVIYTFKPDGTVIFTDSVGSNMTLWPLAARWGSLLANLTLPFTSFSYNTTTVQYVLSLNVLGNTLSLTTTYSQIAGSLGLRIAYSGSLSALTGSLGLHLSGKGNRTVGSSSVFFGAEGYDWSDTSGSTFNNSTGILSWNIPGSFKLDPLSIDASASNSCTGLGSCSATISTSTPNDLVIVYYHSGCGSATYTVADTASSNWATRQPTIQIGLNALAGELWTTSPNAILSSDVVTLTETGGSCGILILIVVAIAGENLNQPFAGNPFETDSAAQASSGPIGLTVEPVQPNQMLIGAVGCKPATQSCSSAFGPGYSPAGFTKIVNQGNLFSFYKIEPGEAAIDNIAFTWSLGLLYYVTFADVICLSGTNCGGGPVSSGQIPLQTFQFNTTPITLPVIGTLNLPSQLTSPSVPYVVAGVVLISLGSWLLLGRPHPLRLTLPRLRSRRGRF